MWGTGEGTDKKHSVVREENATSANVKCGEGGLKRGELSEAEAVRRAQHGDATGFERLYALHNRRVYAVCLRMAGNPTIAEDYLQDAFLQLFRKIHTFRGYSAFSTWLHRLVVNIVLMRLRKKSLPAVSFDELAQPDDESAMPSNDIGVPDPRLSGSIDRLNLERAIAALPLGYRTIFELHDVQGYEHCEVAKIMRCSVGNSKSQLHKARTRLRQFLQESERERSREERIARKKQRTNEESTDGTSIAMGPEVSRSKVAQAWAAQKLRGIVEETREHFGRAARRPSIASAQCKVPSG